MGAAGRLANADDADGEIASGSPCKASRFLEQPAGLIEVEPRIARKELRGVAVAEVAQEIGQFGGRFGRGDRTRDSRHL